VLLAWGSSEIHEVLFALMSLAAVVMAMAVIAMLRRGPPGNRFD
jgi:hypothetical protein